jgi:hypothetical protein
MAVPGITTVTPGDGLSRGRQKVQVRGWQFKIQVSDPTATELKPSVRVTIGGVVAEKAIVFAHYRIDVVTPAYTGLPGTLPAAVDVVVENLDENGDPISGESATLVDGFTYHYPELVETTVPASGQPSAFSLVEQVTETFLQFLQRSLSTEVVYGGADPDYSDDPAGELLAVASLPVITVAKPQVVESMDYRSGGNELGNIDDDGYADVTQAPYAARLSWSIVIITDRAHNAVHAMNGLLDLLRSRPLFLVPVAAGSSERYESDLTFEDWAPDVETANQIHEYSTTVSLEPVYLAGGIPADEVTVHTTEDSDEFLQLEVETV